MRKLIRAFIARVVNDAFSVFNRKALTEDENETLDIGIEKHKAVLRWVMSFALFQYALALVAPEIFTLLSAVSFVSVMLGTAWYAISFQNVSESQLVAGVADYITKKMFRAFVLSFHTLITCSVTFVVKTLLPELVVPTMDEIWLPLRIVLMIGNVAWLLLVLTDVYWASIAYDAADSLLGDGFPKLMRGASAQPKLEPIHDALVQLTAITAAMAKAQGVELPPAPDDDAENDSDSDSDEGSVWPVSTDEFQRLEAGDTIEVDLSAMAPGFFAILQEPQALEVSNGRERLIIWILAITAEGQKVTAQKYEPAH